MSKLQKQGYYRIKIYFDISGPVQIVAGNNSYQLQYVPATIFAVKIGVNCRRQQFMPGDNRCRKHTHLKNFVNNPP